MLLITAGDATLMNKKFPGVIEKLPFNGIGACPAVLIRIQRQGKPYPTLLLPNLSSGRTDCQHGMRETCRVGRGTSPTSNFGWWGSFLDPPYIFVSGSGVAATPRYVRTRLQSDLDQPTLQPIAKWTTWEPCEPVNLHLVETGPQAWPTTIVRPCLHDDKAPGPS